MDYQLAQFSIQLIGFHAIHYSLSKARPTIPILYDPEASGLPKRKETTTSRKAIHPSRVSKLHMKDTRLPPTADRRRNKQEKTWGMLIYQPETNAIICLCQHIAA